MKKQTIRCPYCGSPAVLRDASYVYGPNSFGGKVYVCSHYPACDSYVGVHQGSNLPKGSLANRTLRQKRVKAHQIFDQLWKRGIFSRQDAYRWLADKFCLEIRQAHIGKFSDYMCDQLIQESSKVLENNHIPLGMAG
ncbi:zinc-finger-containing protein [Lachnospiraceae bacterium 48-21]